MTDEEGQPIRVECQTCGYTRTVVPSEDQLPADLIVEHGRNTGHKLVAKQVDEDTGSSDRP